MKKPFRSINRILLSAFILTIILSMGYLLGYIKGTWRGYLSFMQSKETVVGIQLLQNSSLSSVTIGAALPFIPTNKLELEHGYHTFSYKSYGLKLTGDQWKQTQAHFNAAQTISTADDYLDINSPVLIPYLHSQSHNIIVKDGFACMYPVSDGPILCAAGGYGSCLYGDMTMKCSYIANPKKNTVETVSAFITQELQEAGLSCTTATCPITDTGSLDILIPQYSRMALYFSDIPSRLDDTTIVANAKDETTRSEQLFWQAHWKANTVNNTKKEQSWTSDTVLASIEIHASNPRFECVHTVTYTQNKKTNNKQKREMIECWIRQ